MACIEIFGWALGGDPTPTQARLEYREVLRNDPCSYCGGWASWERRVVDHIVARNDYGRHEELDVWANLTAACQRCNGSKSSRNLLSVLLGERVGRHMRAGREVGW